MILFDYQKAMAQVRELRQIAGDMRRLHSQTLTEIKSGVDNGWKGETGQRFLAKCAQLQGRIEKEANTISQLADSLENTANQIAKEERAAAEMLAAKLK